MRLRSLMVCLIFLAGCSAPSTMDPAAGPTPGPTDETSSTPTPSPTAVPTEAPVFRPDPDRRIPSRPRTLARELDRVHSALQDSILKWNREGDPAEGPAPRSVTLQSLYQQRLYREVSSGMSLVRKVARLVPGPLRLAVIRNGTAGWKLRSLVTPVPARRSSYFRTQRPEPAGILLRYYKAAQRRFDVDWEILAAINYVETRFGRIRSSSSAGAQGPMQFMPATWDAYGMGGNVHDPRDAIMGAANYLRASGAPGDYRSALWNYNHADEYVYAILAYARQIMRNEANYFTYYSYQVFMATTKGDVQLTGPGKDV